MWLFEKIRDNIESLPIELSRAVGLNDGTSANNQLSRKLPCNVLTPDKIPDFIIPPKLSKKSNKVMNMTNKNQSHNPAVQVGHSRQIQMVSSRLPKRGGDITGQTACHIIEVDSVCHKEEVLSGTMTSKALGDIKMLRNLLHTRDCYGLSGLYESPNTRRKESLFHSGLTCISLERRAYSSCPRLRPVTVCKPLSEQGSTESDTPSSSDCSPHDSPVLPRSQSSSILSKLLRQETPLGQSAQAGSKQNPRTNESRSHTQASSPKGRLAGAPSLGSFLRPPMLHPLDMLHCQERLQREHVLPLLGRGRMRLSVERDPAGSVLRVRVVSVEDLHDSAHDGRLVHCCVSLCLIPGKHQRQTSATIRNCRNPIFNEDFFFTELMEESFHTLYLRLKVLDKASSLKRDVVLGVISKPLSQLLPL